MAVSWDGTVFPFAQCPDAGTFPTATKDISFPGVDYSDRMDMGLRPRELVVRGFLPDAGGGSPSAADIEALETDKVATLADSIRSFPNCRLIEARTFNFRTAVVAGSAKKVCDYELRFEQLAPAS